MISMKNDIKLAVEEDSAEIRALWDEIFTEDSNEWRDWYFNNIYRPENALVIKENDGIVSMSHFNPYPMVLNGKNITSASLAGVATKTELRNKGYAAELIKESILTMKERGASFSFLYPFDYDFYRKFGYELCYENKFYVAEPAGETEIAVLETDGIDFDADKVYQKYADELNGYIKRSKQYQKIKFQEHFADGNKAYRFIKGDETIGYAMAVEKEDVIEANELICNEPFEAAKALANYLRKKVKFISPFLHDTQNAETKPHCMGRIIDVVGVFDGVRAKEGTMVLEVSDEIVTENNGRFHFKGENGVLSVRKTQAVPDYEVKIGELSVAAVGYEAGLSGGALEFKDMFFEKRTPWIVEVC